MRCAKSYLDLSGSDASLEELTDYICAAEVAKTADLTDYRETTQRVLMDKKRKLVHISHRHAKRPERPVRSARIVESVFPKNMIGFGLPGDIPTYRKLPDDVVGPPYFYYENVACTPKGVWDIISRFLYDIKPEFVDSLHFSAAARKRGYIHNLPLENRQLLLPIPPKTIHEALPETKRWWPSWDKRTKLNCLLTCIGSAQLTEKIRQRLQSGEPSESDKKFVIEQSKKWNLVWVGKCKVAVLEPEEMEMLLGFPKHHTRGGGISRTDRYKSLGNSFQVYYSSISDPIFWHALMLLLLFSFNLS